MVQQISCPTFLFHPDARPPIQAVEEAAGYDISCVAGSQNMGRHSLTADVLAEFEAFALKGSLEIPPHGGQIFRTGFAQLIQPGYWAKIFERSGHGVRLMVEVLAGVIDSNYTDEWFIRLVNNSDTPVTIRVGERIAQVVYLPRIEATMPISPKPFEPTARVGGLGSTGTAALPSEALTATPAPTEVAAQSPQVVTSVREYTGASVHDIALAVQTGHLDNAVTLLSRLEALAADERIVRESVRYNPRSVSIYYLVSREV